MANTLLTIDKITREALRIAHEKATFIGTINRQFDRSWTSEGVAGNTLRIRTPTEYTYRTGTRVMNVQDSVQTSTSLVVATQVGVDMRFNSAELAQSLDSFSKLHLEPAMAVLISNVENDVLQGCMRATYKTAANAVAATDGTAISTITPFNFARSRLNHGLAPMGDRFVQVNSETMANMVNGMPTYFNPANAISEQFREGLVARTAMADFYENERVWTFTNGAVDHSLMTLGGNYISTNGQTSLFVSNHTTALSTGVALTIAGVFDVHPETKVAYSRLKQFVVTAVTNVSNVTISPAIYISGPRQNVSGVGTTSNTAAVSTIGRGWVSTYNMGLMYHRDAFTFATAELPLMADAARCVRKTYDGLSLRVWQASDIVNDQLLTRIDMLYGYAAIRPEWAARIMGAGQ